MLPFVDIEAQSHKIATFLDLGRGRTDKSQFFFTSPKAGTEVKEDSLSRSKLEEEQEITSAEPVDRYMNLADKPFLETSLCHPHNAQPSQSQLDPIASSYSFDGTGLGSPTPTPIGLLLEAYNPSALKERGYLHIREELDRQNRQERTAITDLEQLLPSPELRELALEDIRARLERRFRPGDLPRTLRGAIKLKSMGAECWIEWGKEKGIDYSGHEQRLRGLKYIDKMLGPEKTSDGLLPPSGDGSGLLRGPSYTDDGLTPRNEIMRRIPLHLEQMDLTMILCTDNKDECHWCQGEQCWGIPGGVRFKKEAYEADKADGADKTDETDEANTQPSVMCRDCGNQRYLIGTHAFHGSWKSLPAPSSPPTHAKSYMRQTTCAVCTGLATSICGGCPLRACVNCQVSLDVFCQGNMDRLLNSYGEAGRRNDARLMGSSLAWAAWQRAMRAAAVS